MYLPISAYLCHYLCPQMLDIPMSVMLCSRHTYVFTYVRIPMSLPVSADVNGLRGAAEVEVKRKGRLVTYHPLGCRVV